VPRTSKFIAKKRAAAPLNPTGDAGLHGLIANQIAMAMMAATMTAHTNGVARFELPLRGESLAA
jgi:hypothetical protein